MTTYSLEYFENIIFRGLEYSLPVETIRCIQELQRQLGVHEDNAAHKKNGGETLSKRTTNHTTWKTPPQPVFKSTNFTKHTIDKHIIEIRILMNKLADKNYDKLKQMIVDIIVAEPAETKTVVSTILDMARSNAFLAKLNAKLYAELIETDPQFRVSLHQLWEDYLVELNTLDTKHTIECTKTIDTRKSTTHFLLHLFLADVLPVGQLWSVAKQWLPQIIIWANEANRTFAVDELTECFCLFVHHFYSVFASSFPEEWESMYDEVARISESKSKDYNSFSNRAIFKFRDLIDLI